MDSKTKKMLRSKFDEVIRALESYVSEQVEAERRRIFSLSLSEIEKERCLYLAEISSSIPLISSEILDKSLEDVFPYSERNHLNVQILNAIKNFNCRWGSDKQLQTVRDLVELSPAGLYAFCNQRNFGKRSLSHIDKVLGVKLGKPYRVVN